MNDFLGRLAARALGEAPVVKPRVRSRYEPGGAPQAGEVWGEEVVEVAADREDGRDREDRRERKKEEDGEAAAPQIPGERRAVSRAPVPVAESFEPREAEPLAALTPRTIPAPPRAAPAGEPVEEVVSRPSPALKAAPRPAAAPVAAPEPPARRAEPRTSRPATTAEPAAPSRSREPVPRQERRGGEPTPSPAVPAPAPAPPETRTAVRVSRPAQRGTEPLPTVGPRRGAPDLVPPAERGGEPAAAEEVVRVSIGRIDVHAGPPSAPAPMPRRPAGPRLSLSSYLESRNERRRR